jgi:hypothetical protein
MTEDHGPPANDPLAALVRSAAPVGFSDGFGDRVRARLEADRTQPVTRALERQFVRIVPLAAAAALLLAGYNWWGARGTATSTIDAALNLPQVTLASAYSISSLFGTTVASEQP